MNFIYGYTKKITLQANQRKNEDLYILADSDFIIEKIIGLYDASFKIQIKDTTRNYDWFQNPIRSELFFGTAQYPNKLPYPIEIKRGSLIKFDIENLSDSVNNVELFFEGYRVFEPITLSKRMFFAYPMELTINPLDIYTHQILINNDYDFLINRLIAYKDNDYAFDIKFKVSSLQGSELMSEFTNIDNLFGSVLRPNILIHPLKVVRNSIISFDIRNNLNSPQSIQFMLDGIKLME